MGTDDSDSQLPGSPPPVYLGTDYPMDNNRISKPGGAGPMATAPSMGVQLFKTSKASV